MVNTEGGQNSFIDGDFPECEYFHQNSKPEIQGNCKRAEGIDACDLYINWLYKRNTQNWQLDISQQSCRFACWNETLQVSSHIGDKWQYAIYRDMGGDSFDRHGRCVVSKHDYGTLNSKLQRDINGSYNGRLHLVLWLPADRTNMESSIVR